MRKHKDDMQVNVAGLRRNIKNLAHNYTDAQVKVREATSNDPWGPSATIMAEIAELTNNVVAFSEIMQMIWKRLNDHGKNWRHVYKALILLEYLLKSGNEKVAQQCKENRFAIQTLGEFVYIEEGKDQGVHVRDKAKQLVNLLKDNELLKNERIKALKAKERFAQYPSGFGSDGYIDGPTQRDLRDMPPGWQEEPTKPVSELEMVRPQTAGEEELQLQLAMAMSREEAEQEEAKRRSDDVRLQLALSQSEQDFKVQKQHKEEPQSHLLDLLDIQLGATGISGSPLGLAAGGLSNNTGDPWVAPARAASQMSDPWTGTASPPVDPWQPNAASRSTPLSSVQMGAMGGLGLSMATNGTNGSEAWRALRTQSPSITSGSSTEGWLQTNGNTQSSAKMATALGGTAPVDPWLSKQSSSALAAGTVTNAPADPWLSENLKPNTATIPPQSQPVTDDPWAPKVLSAAIEDPWKNIENNTAAKKSSPDMDEFDIITNRNKTGDLLSTNDSATNISNNNALLLDDLDPLSSTNTSTANSTGATAKKPLKDPQAFLGENSALVNLDNLIKPAVPQNTTVNAAAYNPFSDTVIPPKTNLFQQQQPAVPSINQLKQQSFQMTINQDPWAPVNNTNVSVAQLLSFDSPPPTAPVQPDTINFNHSFDSPLRTAPIRPNTLNLNNNNDFRQTFGGFSNNNNNNNNNFNTTTSRNSTTLKHSHSSNYDALRSISLIETAENMTLASKNLNSNLKTSHTMNSLNNREDNNSLFDSSDVFNTQTTKTFSYSSLYPHVEIVNNNQMYSKSPPSSPIQHSSPSLLSYIPYAPLTPLTPQDTYNVNNNYNNIGNNNQYYNNVNVNANANANTNTNNNNNSSYMMSSTTAIGDNAPATKSFGPNYSHALSASLASTPGVTIMPLHSQTSSASNLFNYGFYDSNNDFFNTQCKLENNNNMPWMKPEAAASNPFLS